MSAADSGATTASGQKVDQEQSIHAMLALSQAQMAQHFTTFGSVLNKVKDDVVQIKADQEQLKQQVYDLTSSKEADSHEDPFRSTPATASRTTSMRAAGGGSSGTGRTSGTSKSPCRADWHRNTTDISHSRAMTRENTICLQGTQKLCLCLLQSVCFDLFFHHGP